MCPINHNHQGTSHGVALGSWWLLHHIYWGQVFIIKILSCLLFGGGMSFFVLPVISIRCTSSYFAAKQGWFLFICLIPLKSLAIFRPKKCVFPLYFKIKAKAGYFHSSPLAPEAMTILILIQSLKKLCKKTHVARIEDNFKTIKWRVYSSGQLEKTQTSSVLHYVKNMTCCRWYVPSICSWVFSQY